MDEIERFIIPLKSPRARQRMLITFVPSLFDFHTPFGDHEVTDCAPMTQRLSAFAQFIALLENLKRVAKDNPRTLVTFYDKSEAIRQAADALQSFLRRTRFERRVFHGARKRFAQVPDQFERAWEEYETEWAPALSHLDLLSIIPEWDREFTGTTIRRRDIALTRPDPDEEDSFDPLWHDGGAALKMGIDYLAHALEQHESDLGDQKIANMCRIGLEAYEYLTETIGIDVSALFQRWRKVPIVFMPAHVSDKHGLAEKGSLNDLLDDALRAYVCGAPAAAIAMCRAALEMVLKRHYGRGQWEDEKLGQLIVLAAQRYEFVQRERIAPLVKRTNSILHDYTKIERLSAEDDRAIVNFLKTVKFLIQRAPRN